MADFRDALSELLRDMKRDTGLKFSNLASRVGCSGATISRVAHLQDGNGREKVTANRHEAILNALRELKLPEPQRASFETRIAQLEIIFKSRVAKQVSAPVSAPSLNEACDASWRLRKVAPDEGGGTLAAYRLLAAHWHGALTSSEKLSKDRWFMELRECLQDLTKSERAILIREYTLELVEEGAGESLVPRLHGADLQEQGDSTAALEEWHDDLKTNSALTMMLRSQFESLSWPDPYGHPWNYVEHFIRHRDTSSTNDPETAKDEPFQKIFSGSLRPLSPLHREFMHRGLTHAFYCDPDCLAYLSSVTFELADENEPKFKIPKRFSHIVPTLLWRLFSGERTVFESTIAAMDIAPSMQNCHARISEASFLSVLVTHYSTALTMFNKNGDKLYSGMKHISRGSKFLLPTSHECPNAIGVVSLIETSDAHLVVVLKNANNINGRASWRPPIDAVTIIDDFAVVKANEDGKLMLEDAAKNAVARALAQYCEQSKKSDVTVLGFALDVHAGKRPFFFCLAKLPVPSGELAKQLVKMGINAQMLRVARTHKEQSLWEILGNDTYRECETLRTAIAFYINFLDQQVDATEESPLKHRVGTASSGSSAT